MHHILRKAPFLTGTKTSLENINSLFSFHFADKELKSQRQEAAHLRPFLLAFHPALLYHFHRGADHVCPRSIMSTGLMRHPCPVGLQTAYKMANAWSLPSLERMWSGVGVRVVYLPGSGQF